MYKKRLKMPMIKMETVKVNIMRCKYQSRQGRISNRYNRKGKIQGSTDKYDW